MIDDAVSGKVDLILTKSISWFGRDTVDIPTNPRKLSDLNPPVVVNFESEGIFTSDGKDKLVISIFSALAEPENQQRSISVREGIRYRMQEGIYKFSVKNSKTTIKVLSLSVVFTVVAPLEECRSIVTCLGKSL
jgi:site-specific DNA recombinase